MITSLQNDKVKLAHGLQNNPRTRRNENKIVLEGVRLIRDALLAGSQPLFALVKPEEHHDELFALIRSHGAGLFPISDEILNHLSATYTSQGILAVFDRPALEPPTQPKRTLILDSIHDPGNLGTMLRTAAAAGVQAVLLSPECVDLYSPKVLRGGMGAHFRVPVVESNWGQIADYCRDTQVYMADSGGDLRYDQANWSSPWALIIGSEAYGVSQEARQIAHQSITIPMAADTESLNAAVAAGVILFEAARVQSKTP